MKINIGAGIQFRSGLARDVYAAGGVRPEFVGDFTGGVYRVDSTASTFADAFTFARTGTATFVDADGILQTAADGVARTGHHIWNGSEWAGPFLQLESEARTNLVTYSEDFSDASWTKGGVSLAAGVTSPDGTSNSTKLVETAINEYHSILTTLTVFDNTAYTRSIFAKAGERSWIKVQQYDSGGGSATNRGVWFNLTTGEVGTQETGCVGFIEPVGNGFYRCSVAYTTSVSTTTERVQVAIATADNTIPLYLGDGTSGVYIYGAQLEAGSTPSSYIPTTGTTATRNAETLTIAAADAPWPEPVVIGPELVTNGDGTTLVGWDDLSTGTGTIASVGGEFELVRVDFSNRGIIEQSFSTDVGSVYTVGIDRSSGSAVALGIGSTSGGIDVLLEELSLGNNVFTFVASSTTTFLNVRGTADGTAYVDNISVQEINPLAVSIQMEGTMTYADEDIAGNVVFFAQRADNDNLIDLKIDTNAALTGRYTIVQREGAVSDFVVSGDDTYSPGINVPFNIASRHGSTFVNGAIDGTALTANLTPTALPDLSATDVQIGPDFMGSIGRIVIWADDIGNAGIAAASA